jgi:uncharacterized membrane protein
LSTLIAITYDDLATGKQAFDALGEMQKMQILELEDAAFASKDAKGKVKVTDTLEKQATGASATWGFFWGFLIGLIFWGLFTALLSGLFSRGRDIGVDNNFMKEVANALEPGGSAIFLLIVKATPDKAVAELAKYGGHVVQTSLSAEDEAALKEALEHEDVKAGVEEHLDLDESEG